MTRVEIFSDAADGKPTSVGEFAFLPRVGEYLSIDNDGVFGYYGVKEVWFRQEMGSDAFQPCIRVELDD